MSELDLLCECLSTEGEAEGGGVKFVWMDENTVYRFENNRMKKIGKQLLNKAKKEITKRNKVQQLKEQNDEDDDDERPRKKSKKVKKQSEELEDDGLFPKPRKVRQNILSIDDDELDADESENERPKRGKKLTRTKASAALPSVDLDEYYDNKHRMEYMTLEITRLNNKIGKLKQYKSIVNKLTGGEIDDLPSLNQQQQQQQQQAESSASTPSGKQKYNESLFMF